MFTIESVEWLESGIQWNQITMNHDKIMRTRRSYSVLKNGKTIAPAENIEALIELIHQALLN